MKYELLSIEESGNKFDYIVALRQQPNRLERWLGHRDERVAFYGHDDQWNNIDGTQPSRSIRNLLCRIWKEHRPAVNKCEDSSGVKNRNPARKRRIRSSNQPHGVGTGVAVCSQLRSIHPNLTNFPRIEDRPRELRIPGYHRIFVGSHPFALVVDEDQKDVGRFVGAARRRSQGGNQRQRHQQGRHKSSHRLHVYFAFSFLRSVFRPAAPG